MEHGIYIGDDLGLKGEGALVRDDPESRSRGVLVQFDDLALLMEFTHGWVSFQACEFKIDRENE